MPTIFFEDDDLPAWLQDRLRARDEPPAPRPLSRERAAPFRAPTGAVAAAPPQTTPAPADDAVVQPGG